LNIIFIGSYLNIPCVIDVIEREKGDFRILSTDVQVLNVFAEFYGENKVYKIPQIFESFGNFRKIITDSIRTFGYKEKLLKDIKALKPKQVFFFFLGWNGLSSWLLKRLSTTCSLYYRPKVNIELLESDFAIKAQIKSVIASMVCGIRLRSGKFYGYSLIAIDDRFLKQLKVNRYEFDVDHNNIKKFLSERFSYLSKVKVIILNGGMYNVSEVSYTDSMKLVWSKLIEKYESSEICIKDHPNFPIIELAFLRECVAVPPQFPASLLCYNCEVVISYSSATLYEAANLGIKSISLVNLIPTTKPQQIKQVIDYLEEHLKEGEIQYPCEIESFEGIL